MGFCTTTGGATSHVAILARSLGLPALAGVDVEVLNLPEGMEILLDAESGEVRPNPSEDDKTNVIRYQNQQAEIRRKALASSQDPAITRDGQRIEVLANIGSVQEAQQAVELGCDGVGLLRSEFLFLERKTAPTEDEQFEVYSRIAAALGTRPLTIRTLDIGGDKPLAYLPLPKEDNPFLGLRGVRVSLKYPEIFRTQLRAILRVRHEGPLSVMFPLVATLQDFRRAKAILEEERRSLGAPNVQIGIMVEVPSVALQAEEFAREVDFFSIGTNDLSQYTLAIDRGHSELAKEMDRLHPSILKLIALSVEGARRHGKPVCVCGGLASDEEAAPLLVRMGVEELSVSLPMIPLIKSTVRNSNRDLKFSPNEGLNYVDQN